MKNKNTGANAKKRLNMIDVLILAVVIICVVGLVIRFSNFGFSGSARDLDDYEILFSVSNIAYTSEDYFVHGDTVTIAENGVVLGQLSGKVNSMPAMFETQYKDGKSIAVSYPEASRIDVKGAIASRGKMGDNGYLVGGTTYIAPGSELLVQSEHMDFVLKITDIVKK